MRITKIDYSELRSFGNYQNRTLGATAEVGPDETPEGALAALRAWVSGQLDALEAGQRLGHDLQELEACRNGLERDIQGLQDRFERAKEFLASIGIAAPKRWQPDGELPF